MLSHTRYEHLDDVVKCLFRTLLHQVQILNTKLGETYQPTSQVKNDHELTSDSWLQTKNEFIQFVNGNKSHHGLCQVILSVQEEIVSNTAC